MIDKIIEIFDSIEKAFDSLLNAVGNFIKAIMPWAVFLVVLWMAIKDNWDSWQAVVAFALVGISFQLVSLYNLLRSNNDSKKSPHDH
jgi:hypothetical protein